VLAARERQHRRLGPARCNAEMSPAELRRHSHLDREARRMLAEGHERLGLSGRGWDRVVRVARTIADLAGNEVVGEPEVAEALNMRRRDDDDLVA
jgi:magnesium chelatase family protein